jgi:hypothetical protein
MIKVDVLTPLMSTVSDLLMGIYLLVIGTQDSQFRDIYHKEAHNWMSSWRCTIIGMLAMTSSEVSVCSVASHSALYVRSALLAVQLNWFVWN